MENTENLEQLQDNVQNSAAGELSNSESRQQDNGTHQEHIREALELLYVHFPKAFIKDGDCKPLKIGILDDLKERIAGIEGLSVSKVRAAVRVYTTRLRYFYSVREGVHRIDLDGNETDVVNAEHAEYARERFTEINNRRRTDKAKGSGKGSQGRKFAGRDANGGRRRQGAGQGRFEKAGENDLRLGRYVFVSIERNYVRGTVSAVSGNESAKITLQNGLSITVPLNRIFVKKDQPAGANRNSRGDQSRAHSERRRFTGPKDGRHQGERRKSPAGDENVRSAEDKAEQ